MLFKALFVRKTSFYIHEIEFQIEFNFSRESKTIKFHTYISLKIDIQLPKKAF